MQLNHIRVLRPKNRNFWFDLDGYYTHKEVRMMIWKSWWYWVHGSTYNQSKMLLTSKHSYILQTFFIKTSFLKLDKVVYSGVFFVDYRINVICVRINGFNSIREFLLICSKFCGIFSTDSGDFKALQFLYCSILSKQLILRIIFKQFQHVWSGSFW